MRIRKDNLFSYFENLLGCSFYVGLHGIADDSDLKNEYSSLSKEDKAKNILNTGLINSRCLSIKSTCKIFGRLSETYKDNKNLILDFNKYRAYRTEGRQYIVIVAVPIMFLPNDGRMLFGGWMDCNVPYNDDTSPFECITDKLCMLNIPSEFILGYYSYEDNNDYVEFNFNNDFYSNLSRSKKDEFIEKLYAGKKCEIDLMKGTDYCKRVLEESRNRWFYHDDKFDLAGNLIRQLNTDFSYNEDLNFDSTFSYSNDSFNNIGLDELDLSMVKPNYEMIFNGKYGSIMKEIIINNRYFDKNLADIVGFYYDTKIDRDSYIDLIVFEEWLKLKGSNPNMIYHQYYQMNYKDINLEFINYLKFLKESSKK